LADGKGHCVNELAGNKGWPDEAWLACWFERAGVACWRGQAGEGRLEKRRRRGWLEGFVRAPVHPL